MAISETFVDVTCDDCGHKEEYAASIFLIDLLEADDWVLVDGEAFPP